MTAVVVTASFLLMELVSYLAHRFLMHGPGMTLHASHHASLRSRFEANDLFPVGFAALTIMAMAVGATWPSFDLLLTIGAGVTAYGAAYVFVHDVYIHARLGRLPEVGVLEWLKSAHRLHHLYGGEPYGMLLPITAPKELWARAEVVVRDPFGDR